MGIRLSLQLRAACGFCSTTRRPKDEAESGRSDYVSAYSITLRRTGTLRTWFAVTPRGAKYNLPDAPATLWVGEPDTKWPPDAKASLQALGFEQVKDIAGYVGFRLGYPVAEIQSLGDESTQVKTLLARLAPVFDALASA